jgi:hypothetical protein
MIGCADRRIIVRRVFSIGRTIALIRKIAFQEKANLFLSRWHVSAEVKMGAEVVSETPPIDGLTHMSQKAVEALRAIQMPTQIAVSISLSCFGMFSPEGFRQPFEKFRLSPQASHIPGFARSYESE